MKKPTVEETNEMFERFWLAGMYKTKKKAARVSFSKLVKNLDIESALNFTSHLINDVRKRLEIGQFGFDGMHPTTYLNGERWEDEYRGRINVTNKSTVSFADEQRNNARAATEKLNAEALEYRNGASNIRAIR